ncbi:MAG: hypothetical protein AAFQ90_05510 [Pseudomonadota bacterium]
MTTQNRSNAAPAIASALAALTLAANASAASANTARFACDTAEGRVSEFRVPIKASRFTLSGTIKPALFRGDDKWLPTAVVQLKNRETGNAMIMSLTAPSGEAPGAMVSVQQKTGGETKRSDVGTLAVGNLVNFTIVYNRGAQNRFVIGEQPIVSQGDLGTAFDLSLSCSTGDFVFEELVWTVEG